MSESQELRADHLPFITRVRIEKLFGYRQLDVEFSSPASPDDRPINIIYGDNGSGKTTLLKFAYEFLNPQAGGGHKSWVAKLPFSRATIVLGDGSTFDINKHKGLVGAYTVAYTFKGNTKNYRILVDEYNSVKGDNKASQHDELLSILSSLRLNLFFITDDRQYLSTTDILPAIQSKSSLLDIARSSWNVDNKFVIRYQDDDIKKPAPLSVARIALVLADLFRSDIARTGISAQRSTNAIYSELVGRISSGTSKKSISRADITRRISDLHSRMRRFVDLGAISDFDYKFYIDSVVNVSPSNLHSVSLVIAPFLDSLSAQLDALQPAVGKMTSFLAELNNFYTDKEFRFSYNGGLTVFSGAAGGEVSLDWFSSGERQLFIILSSVFLAQGGAGIVLIDEPELSLNIVWQRKFVPALHRLSRNAPIQYVLASHSPEILNSDFGRELPIGD